MRSNHAALAVVSEEECNRLGSVFFGVLCASLDVAMRVYQVPVGANNPFALNPCAITPTGVLYASRHDAT